MRTFLLSVVIFACYTAAVYGQEYVPGEIIVSFRDQSTEVFTKSDVGIRCAYSDIMSYLSNEGLVDAREIYHGPKGVKNIYVLRFREDSDVLRIVRGIKSFEVVEGASPNYCGQILSEPDDFEVPPISWTLS